MLAVVQPAEFRSKQFRLGVLFERLAAAPMPHSFEQAWALIDATLREVEDQYTGLSYDPSTQSLARRMYIPAMGNTDIWRHEGRWWNAELFCHWLRISDSGQIEVIEKSSSQLIFEKP